MNIVLVSTFDSGGGAAIACYRLAQALQAAGHEITILVAEKKGNDDLFTELNPSFLQQKLLKFRFALERLELLARLKHKKDIFQFSIARFGQDIHSHPAIKQADVVNLHWVTHNFLSLDSLKKLQATGKPIVWTLHDMWAFTGGCHYAGNCDHFMVSCGNCPYSRKPAANDISAQTWQNKRSALKPGYIQYVTCSQWLGNELRKSSLLGKEIVTAIPNTIDTGVFKPQDKTAAKQKLGLNPEKFHMLFASANTKDDRKGFKFFKEALDQITESNPDFKDQVEVVMFGKMTDDSVKQALKVPVKPLGQLSSLEAIAGAYNAADTFVIPSLQDNLPNTIMESLACGTPVVGFETGGIPEMIVHEKTGYLCPPKSVEGLTEGLLWISQHPDSKTLSANARQFVMEQYDAKVVAQRYTNAYQQAINSRKQ